MLREQPLHQLGFLEYPIPYFMPFAWVFGVARSASALSHGLDHRALPFQEYCPIQVALEGSCRQVLYISGQRRIASTAKDDGSGKQIWLLRNQFPSCGAAARLTRHIDAF